MKDILRLHVLVLAGVLMSLSVKAQTPAIASVSPTSGTVGTTVTILGSNFDAVAANNIVYFGTAQATVNTASASELVVTVPHGATYAPVTVMVNNLIAQSIDPFVVTFDGNDAIDANTFLAIQTEVVPTSYFFLTLGDLDGDGLLDLVAIDDNATQLSVYRNTSSGPGSISLGSASPFTVHEETQEAVLSDFDGDGKLDIAVCNNGASTRHAKISILRNTSSGPGNISFATAVDYDIAVSSNLHSLAAGDLDGDGKLDIAFTYSNLDRVRVFKNQSSGPGVIDFQPQIDVATGISPASVTIADMDGDNVPDIVVADNTPNVAVLRNTSTAGSFSFENKVDFALPAAVNHVTTGDIDGDGLADIVTSHVSAELSVFRNTSTVGSLSMATRQDYSTTSIQTALTDVNGDGMIEMMSLNGASVSVYKNTSTVGAVSHAAAQAYNSGGFSASSITVGDMDNDGEPDLLVQYSTFPSGAIGIFKNARSENALLSFSFPEQTGAATIDAGNHTVDIEVTNGTDLTNLTATFMASTTASDVAIGATSQTSGVTTNDFTNPVVYAVAAEDALVQNWTVTVTVAGSCTPDNVNANESACSSFDFDGATLTASGTYNATLVNQAGCDSLVTLTLTILEPTSSLENTTTCDNYLWNGVTYAASGSYHAMFTNAAGCDSTAMLNLTINPSFNESVNETACGSFNFDGNVLTSSGTYNGAFTSAAGCDSLVTLTLTIVDTFNEVANVSVCESYDFDGSTLTASGTYNGAFTSVAGCDSLVTLNLTILEPTTSMEAVAVCESYAWNGTTYTNSGSYQEMFTNAAGCDSTATLNLTILEPSSSVENTSACDSYLWNGTNYSASGTHQSMFTNVAGCDSTATLNLTILESTSSVEDVEECDSYAWNGTTYTVSGTYQSMFTNAAGCDSTATLNLTILESDAVDTFMDSCGDYQFGSQLLTQSGVYMETFSNQAGCDSTVTLTFGHIPLPEAEIEVNGVILFANEISGASYQWYNCDTNEPISGEDKRQLTPPRTGEYYVEVTTAGCSSVSDCILFDWVLNVDELDTRSLIYPTVIESDFTLDLKKSFNDVRIRVISLEGKEVLHETHKALQSRDFRLDAPSGMYLIHISVEGQEVFSGRILKK